MSRSPDRQQVHYRRHPPPIRLDDAVSIPVRSPSSAPATRVGGFGLRDPSGRLAELLANYSTKSNYKLEADGAVSLLGDLLEFLPRCYLGPMWTLDVLSVGFRSLALSKLADEGIYSFANSDIVGGLTKTGLIRQSEAYQLQSLRQFKSLYRRGIVHSRIGWGDTYGFVRLIDRRFSLGLSSRCANTLDILESALEPENSAQLDSHWYVRCRRIESALLMLRPQQNQNRTAFLAACPRNRAD